MSTGVEMARLTVHAKTDGAVWIMIRGRHRDDDVRRKGDADGESHSSAVEGSEVER